MRFNRKFLKLFFSLIILALIFLAYFIGQYKGREKEPTVNKRANYQAGYKYISPLLECALNEIDTPVVTTLEEELREYIAEAKEAKNVTDVSVYFHELNTGNWLGIDRTLKFSPASLLKVPILITYLKLAESDPDLLQQKVDTLDFKVEVINPNIIPLKSIQPNQTYTIEELLYYTIHYSDNRAANLLLDLLNEEQLNSVYSDIGLKIPGTEGDENFMNVVDYAAFFEILYNATYLNKEMSEKALAILTKSTFNYGLVGGVPIGVEVAHKFGERIFEEYKQLHDCGIIYKENNPYLLCIMTRGDMMEGDNFNDLAMVIKKISEQVYNTIGE